MSDTDSSYGEYAEDETFEQMMDRMEQRDTSDEEGSDKPTQRRYSVALDGAASFSVCDRSKRSVALRRAIACFCLLYTSPSPRDVEESRMPSSA